MDLTPILRERCEVVMGSGGAGRIGGHHLEVVPGGGGQAAGEEGLRAGGRGLRAPRGLLEAPDGHLELRERAAAAVPRQQVQPHAAAVARDQLLLRRGFGN